MQAPVVFLYIHILPPCDCQNRAVGIEVLFLPSRLQILCRNHLQYKKKIGNFVVGCKVYGGKICYGKLYNSEIEYKKIRI